MRPSPRSGRSRLTSAPGSREPSVVTRSVSGPTSALNASPVCTTVRQTPLTATLSPSFNSAVSGDRTESDWPPVVDVRAVTSPVASMRPVNIALNQDVRPERHHAPSGERRRRKPAAVEKWHPAGTQHVRRHVEPHKIDHVFLPGSTLQRGAALQQQRADVAFPQALERGAERTVRRDRDLCPVV